jgi:hypothetical protein
MHQRKSTIGRGGRFEETAGQGGLTIPRNVLFFPWNLDYSV